jgi:hypothetical protein
MGAAAAGGYSPTKPANTGGGLHQLFSLTSCYVKSLDFIEACAPGKTSVRRLFGVRSIANSAYPRRRGDAFLYPTAPP